MIESFIFIGEESLGSALSEKLVAAGYKLAPKLAEADVVLVYCDSQSDTEDMFFETDGIIQRAKNGSYLVNLSTCTPNFSRELNAVALVSDLHALEAPLMVLDSTLPKVFADHANLDCFVSGEEDDVEVIIPLLSAIAANVRVSGPSGSAQLAHAALTVQRSAQIVACMEAEALFRAYSSSSDSAIRTTYEQGIISDSSLKMFAAIKNEQFNGDYTIKMWMAELTSALMTADDAELILPGAESCIHLLELLAVIGGDSLAPAALSLVYGEESACIKHGLDWTLAEQIYGEEGFDHDFDEDPGHDHGDFPGGFGSYSSN